MAPVVYENEESLISACRQALLVDPDVSPAALLEIMGEGSGAPIWASGQKISLNSVKKAQRVARTRLDAEQAARDAAVESAAASKRVLTQRAIEFAEKNHGAGATIDPHATCVVECRLEGLGPQVAVRHPAEFQIIACDGTGSRKETGGDMFFVAIRGTQRVRARIVDNDDGSYLVTWTPPQSGSYQVAVSCFGVSLPGSPFATTATTPVPYAPNCTVQGAALSKAVARATQAFEICFRDRLGYTTHAVDLDVYVEPVPEPLIELDTAATASTAKRASPAACPTAHLQ